ncbi:cAMP-regulated phosphoprotein 21 isoform X1 [Neodiprion pinetum]|uniref:cAMP-regulated phosphoprotein 21 isoform X1 n=1 Tax=Neodiprion pinetum TaxID=441929 RepID=UPI001EDD762B|nr:cAMP-regulated phosphoprotein 21 isoform X1 [Neodiprion pinetum]XP_046483893.1 cAMP-regulated phosphoprotein 21 isoform X1 [Neodiprion pinetum]XP_046483895.1 cAMP-regulated phosphoprotein 21 isoform X1 [Neodiprion pinetum]XP_046483896.1 cAMP-regulated phosphoprotein 21 isoform X1 [Neodiprion pinetum]XP_046483897.1 cAMP-regulated phosphoprotein 21 isoform X1 [Neodiprion pinetum]XP_046483898.1 cAMP-regulated phosphoprotein 21 isoform X1 [Neodiprion pinetum]XP_046483899.1 cAMP-regulated phosp
MPSLPYSRHEPLVSAKLSKSVPNMIGGTTNIANESCPTSTSSSLLSVSISSLTPISTPAVSTVASDKLEHLHKTQRNRSHAKIKLLVRSHAMRESTSPPREPNGLQPAQDAEKITARNSSTSPGRPKPLNNNNEPILDGNIPRLTSDVETKIKDCHPVSQTCPNSIRNGQLGSPEALPPKNTTPVVDAIKTGAKSPTEVGNYSSCGSNTSPGLLQTSSFSNSQQTSKSNHGLQHSPRSTNLAQQMHSNERNRGDQTKSNSTSSLSFTCNVPCSNQCGNSSNNNNNNNNNTNNNNTLSVSRPGSRHKMRHRNASQGSFEATSPSISRDSSTELYTDSTGIDLEQFIGDTLNRNQKDRTVLLRIERELVDFARDRQRVCHKFPNMSSYNRMLVHRVAAYFGMEHNVDQTGLCVVVTRTKNTRIPDTRFKESIRDDIVLNEEPKRSILKRDSNSFEESFNFKSPDRFIADYCRRSKSFEEREEEYERARRRIFKDSSVESTEAASWPWSSAESSDALPKPRMSHTLISDHRNRQPMLLKVESFHENGSQRRPSVPKSYSFGGYAAGGMLSRDNSITSTRSAGARLTKQDSGTSTCSRLSPSSSGYKSQSQRSDATISPSPSPSPVMPAGQSHSQISGQEPVPSSPNGNGQQTVIWAVTDIASVPVGSVIIDPQTNLTYKNSDGSVYRFDPENPPQIFPDRDRREKRVSGETEEEEQEEEEEEERPVIEKNCFPPQKITEQHKRRARHEKNSSQAAAMFTNSATSPNPPFDTTTTQVSQQLPVPRAQQQQQRNGGQHTLVKNYAPHVYTHGPQIHPQTPYASYVSPSSQANNQSVYLMHARPSSAITISPYQPSTQIRVEGSPQVTERGDMICCNQNPMIASYQIPGMQPGIPPQPYEEVAELSGSFIGMNLYDQRGAGDGQSVAVTSQPYQHSPQTQNPVHRTQPGSPACWQSHTSQIPLRGNNLIQVQPAMYFVPPSPAGISNGPTPVDARQHLQRFAAAYSYNHPSGVPTPTNQAASSYVGGYPTPTIPAMPVIPGMQSPQTEFSYQPTTHVIPTYYNTGQASMQPTPMIYGVPTPPNTPSNSQMSSVAPLMFVNSNGYPPSALIAGSTFGHQVGGGGGQSASSYMGASLVPNVMLRQTIPAVSGIRASTQSSLQRTSRSPDAGQEIFGVGGRDRNPQPQYQMPLCQGVHIVQGVPGNPRLQYAPAPSPLSSQGCPRPYRPPSYTASTSNEGARNPVDNRSQKPRKHR